MDLLYREISHYSRHKKEASGNICKHFRSIWETMKLIENAIESVDGVGADWSLLFKIIACKICSDNIYCCSRRYFAFKTRKEYYFDKYSY